jgi:hypothetical protein
MARDDSVAEHLLGILCSLWRTPKWKLRDKRGIEEPLCRPLGFDVLPSHVKIGVALIPSRITGRWREISFEIIADGAGGRQITSMVGGFCSERALWHDMIGCRSYQVVVVCEQILIAIHACEVVAGENPRPSILAIGLRVYNWTC